MVRLELRKGASAPARGPAAAFVGADADLPWAAARCSWSACAAGGTRLILVEKSAHAEFRRLLAQNVKELEAAALPDEAAAAAVEERIKDAVARGARLWAGGGRTGASLPAALLENVPADSSLLRADAPGPVAALAAVESPERALDRLAAAGGPAAVFTNDLTFVHRAFERLSLDVLFVNDVPRPADPGEERVELRATVVKP